MKCVLCPRHCNADREKTYGVCASGLTPRVARVSLHHWEEPCISGENGSGTVFFTGCSLHCVYCQNQKISKIPAEGGPDLLPGKEADTAELIRIFYHLREKKAHNINLVTGDHFIPAIAGAIKKARTEGFDLPFVFNCSGYETRESLRMLDGLIDIYLADFKYAEKELAKAYSNAEDYPEVARLAVSEMVRQQPGCEYDGKGMLKKGVIVRNLLLPKHVYNSRKVLKYLHETYGDRIIISILSQYTPGDSIPDCFPELKRKVSRAEYDRLTDYAIKIGIENAFIQEITSSDSGFIPDFDCYTG